MPLCNFYLFGEGIFRKAHLMGKTDQGGNFLGRGVRFDRKIDLDPIAKPLTGTLKHRTLFMEMGGDLNPLVPNGYFPFDRNLRYVGKQSKRHAGGEVSERGRCRALTPRHVIALV